MPSGTLGIANPLASTWTSVYTVPALKVSTVNIRLVNLDTIQTSLVRVAIGNASGAPASNGEYIEPIDYPMEGGEILEDSAIVVGPGNIVKVFSNTANIAVRVHGFEAPQ